jgi:hypothetical protein
MRIYLLLRWRTNREAAVYAGVIAVVQAHDVHEDDIARLQQAI